MKKILIIGERADPHIQLVTNLLEQLGASVKIFDLDKFSEHIVNVEYSTINTEAFGEILDFQLSQIDTVWYRIKPSMPYPKNTKENFLWSEFAYREWKSIIDSLHFFTPNALWINPRLSDLKAREKPTQLLLAKQLGFRIPPTLISNDSTRIIKFLEKNKGSIYKTLTWYFEYPNKLIFTSRVDPRKVTDNIDSIKICPGIFQKEIEKLFEIRVTTVGKKIFSVKIDSQSRNDTKLDWRRNQFQLTYSVFELPRKMINLINQMNSKLGLHYAAYDFIVTPNEEFYFLEVNPGGQWLWVERRTGLQISNALAEYMVSQKPPHIVK